MSLTLHRSWWLVLLAATGLAALLSARLAQALLLPGLWPRPELAVAPAALHVSLPGSQRGASGFARLASCFGLTAATANATVTNENADKPGSGLRRSPLHAVLAGTAVTSPARYSLCQIHDLDAGETSVFALGERILGARIYGIEKDRVLLDNQGRLEYLDGSATPGATAEPARGGGIEQTGAHRHVIRRAAVDAALTNLPELALQARLAPAFRDGVSTGFRFFSIVPGSIYARLGLRDGDVVRRINGYDLNSPERALELYTRLRDAARIEVELERGGETLREQIAVE